MTASVPSVRRLAALVASLEAGLLEREAAARLTLLAALAGEHVLLIGPPGTAKSELARRLHRAFAGTAYFERLLTRFSTPDELFGPLSMRALEDDRYERLTAGYLPEAGIAFLDEVFKANSAILNALLTLLNEREFDNGAGRSRTPLLSVVAASNEVPADDSLLAFYDRFLVRVPIVPVSDAAFVALLQLDAPEAANAASFDRVEPLSADEVGALQRRRTAVHLPAIVLAHLQSLRTWLASRAMPVSDRRWRQLIGLLRCAAASEGRREVAPSDLWLAAYVVSAQPAQVAAAQAWFVTQVMQAAPDDAPWFTRAVEAFEQQLALEREGEEIVEVESAGKLAVARSIGTATSPTASPPVVIERDLAGLRLHPTSPASGRRRYSVVHVAARLGQLDELRAHTAGQREASAERCAALEQALDPGLWLPPALASALRAELARTLARFDALLVRLDAARAGFAALPIDPAARPGDGTAPAPVAVPP